MIFPPSTCSLLFFPCFPFAHLAISLGYEQKDSEIVNCGKGLQTPTGASQAGNGRMAQDQEILFIQCVI